MKKKALSQVIATILIILLVLVAIGIIAPIVINIVRGGLEGKDICFQARDELKIAREDAYNCYDKNSKTANITVYRGDVDMDKFYITIVGQGVTKEINKNEFSSKNEEKTYEISVDLISLSILPKVEIYPEINGKKCGVTDDITLKECS